MAAVLACGETASSDTTEIAADVAVAVEAARSIPGEPARTEVGFVLTSVTAIKLAEAVSGAVPAVPSNPPAPPAAADDAAARGTAKVPEKPKSIWDQAKQPAAQGASGPSAKPSEAAGASPTQNRPDVGGSVAEDATARKAPAPIKVPKSGTANPAYYDDRAKAIIADEQKKPVLDGMVEAYPDHNIVTCIAGCSTEQPAVVFLQRKPDRVVVTSGEVVPSADRGDASEPEGGAASPNGATVAEAVSCVAGCYDDTPRRYLMPSRGQRQQAIDEDAADKVSKSRSEPTPGAREVPIDDWMSIKKKSERSRPGLSPLAPAGKVKAQKDGSRAPASSRSGQRRIASWLP